MSSPPPEQDGPEERLNLARLTVLVVESSVAEQDLMVQMLNGFGVRHIRRCGDTIEARAALATSDVGLVVLDASPADGRAYDFVQWLRRDAPEGRRFLPVLMLKGHVQTSQVARARDCGASFVIAKPISARVLLDRISWLAREPRGFLAIEGGYVGPDRRFRADGPPAGCEGRRKSDAPPDPNDPFASSPA